MLASGMECEVQPRSKSLRVSTKVDLSEHSFSSEVLGLGESDLSRLPPKLTSMMRSTAQSQGNRRRSATDQGYRVVVENLVESALYKASLACCIVSNTVIICLEADTKAKGATLPYWTEAMSMLLLCVYIVDIILKVYALREEFILSALNIFDCLVIVVDCASSVITAWHGKEVPSLTILRTFRLLRIIRVLNTVLIMRELVLMMQGLLSASRAIAFGTFLIFVVLTTWSILAVQFIHPVNLQLADAGVYGDCLDCREAFASVMKSNLTFMKTILAGDSWGQLALPLLRGYPGTAAILVPTFISVQLGLVNVIAAVIVDRQTQARVNDENLSRALHEEELQRSYKRHRLLFELIDVDGGGSLTLDEMIAAYDAVPEFRDMLNLLDIHRTDIPMLFEVLDYDDSGDVTYSEFVERFHHLRFLNDHTMLVFTKQNCETIKRSQIELIDRIDALMAASGLKHSASGLKQSPVGDDPVKDTTGSEAVACATCDDGAQGVSGVANKGFVTPRLPQQHEELSGIILAGVERIVQEVITYSASGQCPLGRREADKHELKTLNAHEVAPSVPPTKPCAEMTDPKDGEFVHSLNTSTTCPSFTINATAVHMVDGKGCEMMGCWDTMGLVQQTCASPTASPSPPCVSVDPRCDHRSSPNGGRSKWSGGGSLGTPCRNPWTQIRITSRSVAAPLPNGDPAVATDSELPSGKGVPSVSASGAVAASSRQNRTTSVNASFPSPPLPGPTYLDSDEPSARPCSSLGIAGPNGITARARDVHVSGIIVSGDFGNEDSKDGSNVNNGIAVEGAPLVLPTVIPSPPEDFSGDAPAWIAKTSLRGTGMADPHMEGASHHHCSGTVKDTTAQFCRSIS
eukprot:TRINITY_DN31403_c0_g1_i1.p1 TRINITY_DN31403_c0_g1~~TRINITY_DN31403_c0_g1_i1.p1  ORF type:complete len:859 (+),score=116.74 TRINITY_DN31403_c0_g1_i1:35-2611(+)